MYPFSDTQLDDLAARLADRVAERLADRMTPPVSVGPPAGIGDAMASSASEWLTAAQAAEYLSMRAKALYTAVERRQIPASRLGRRLRFHRAGLDRLLSGRAGKIAARVPSLATKESERWSS